MYTFFPLLVHNNELKCSASGQALKSQNPDREVNFYKGEEESYADASNQLMNVGSTKNALQFLTSIIVVVFALKIIAWECYNNGQKKLLCKLNKYASYVFGSLMKYLIY